MAIFKHFAKAIYYNKARLSKMADFVDEIETRQKSFLSCFTILKTDNSNIRRFLERFFCTEQL